MDYIYNNGQTEYPSYRCPTSEEKSTQANDQTTLNIQKEDDVINEMIKIKINLAIKIASYECWFQKLEK